MSDHAPKSTFAFRSACLCILSFKTHPATNKWLVSVTRGAQSHLPHTQLQSLYELWGTAGSTVTSRVAWSKVQFPRGSCHRPAWTQTKIILQMSPMEVLFIPSYSFQMTKQTAHRVTTSLIPFNRGVSPILVPCCSENSARSCKHHRGFEARS